MLRSSKPPSRPALGRQVCAVLNASIQPLRRVSNSNGPLPPKTSPRADSDLNISATKVAVLGGGITGLAAALWLKTRLRDKAQITIFESSNRLGGWLKSTKHTVNGETVVFEQGPRSLRPVLSLAGVTTDYTLRTLGLTDQILPTSRDSAAALNRFIYYPDRIYRVPNWKHGLLAFWNDSQSPLFRGSIMPVLAEFSKKPRSPALQDESLRSFMLRRFSPGIADNVLSAVIHGIYAGDIDRLSARSLLSRPWDNENSHGSVLKGVLSELSQRKSPIPGYEMSFFAFFAGLYARGDAYYENWCSRMFELRESASLYTFKGGMEELAKALSSQARSLGVEFRYGTHITELTPRNPGSQGPGSSSSDSRVPADDAKIDVSWTWSPGETKSDTFTHVISALPANAFLSALSNERSQRAVLETSDVHRLSIPTVTVMVVNLYYRNPRLVKQPGFGYLLPRSLAFEQNPEFALGVVFDSYATPDLDDSSGTKLTVMLGGHWWDGWNSFPSEAEGIRMARSLVQRQLDIVDEPALAIATLQKDCIPQYHVGHTERATALGSKLRKAFGGHLEVAGASWHGVSVNDCIKSGFLAAYSIAMRTRQVDLMEAVDRTTLRKVNVPRGRVATMFKRPAEIDELLEDLD